MSEYVTRAIVLGMRQSKEHDKIFDLYTEDLGRVRVRAPGGKKILSKLSPHLDVMSLVTIKIVEKNNLTLVDALLENDFKSSKEDAGFFRRALSAIEFLRFMSPEAVPDAAVWDWLVTSLSGKKLDFGEFVSVMGYDARHASCDACQNKEVLTFNPSSQNFLCRDCSLKTDGNNLIYLK